MEEALAALNHSSSGGTPETGRDESFLDRVARFERDFDGLAGKHFLENNWPLAFGVISLYLAFIHLGQAFMKNRERLDVRIPLIVWNLVLGSFSILGTYRAWPYFVDSLRDRGVYGSVCDNSFYQMPVVAFWSHVFTLSKLVELGDTVFIVLRKQPLIFLHWYHHITVLLYCWLGNSEFSATGQVFGIMNYAVHSLMYTYYALRAMRIRLPTILAFFITTFQLSQMIVGIAMNLMAYSYKSAGRQCSTTDLNIRLSFLMYFSYFILFANFFHKTYFKKGAKRSVVAKKTEQVLSQAQILAKKAM